MSSTQRVFRSFELTSPKNHLRCFLDWACKKSPVVAFLNSCGINHDPHAEFDAVMAIGIHKQICPEEDENAFECWKTFLKENHDWLFGFLSYDLKNQTEKLTSLSPDGILMPLMHFFIPEILIFQRGNTIDIGLIADLKQPQVYETLFDEMHASYKKESQQNPIRIQGRIPKEEYLQRVRSIKKDIQQGDIYEMNYCIEFFAENVSIDPVAVFEKLNLSSPAPFSCFYKLNDKFLISSSPERFLAKRGEKLISQPIKGTAPRNQNPEKDKMLKEQLYNDPKERSENVMIVDLVRNDLSQSAKQGSVKVDELFGIYSYQHVHQMVSTISCSLRKDVHFVDAVKNAFPMGSMTGAPKIRAMEIIEENEVTRRGLYSGAVGYITPCGNFDFNVIIRSILYNQTRRYASFMAGSAITILSEPEKEYQECLLKASSLAKVLGSCMDFD